MNEPYDKWRRFPGLILATTIVSSALIYLAILVIDPYDSVPFSPAWERSSVTSANRHYTAVIAKKAEFDSAVIGSSSSMLLDPQVLNPGLDAQFANLAMQAASPYEQQKTLSLFLRHHPKPKNIVIGLDHIWCQPAGAKKFVGFASKEGFPEWLYDGSTWNDLPPFNGTTLRHTRYQLMALTGLRTKYDRRSDGYEDITLDLHHGRNDMESVRRRIYGHRSAKLRPPGSAQGSTYPNITELANALASLPEITRKILFFAPTHQVNIAKRESPQGRYWQGCKAAILERMAHVSSAVIVDFNIRSPITCEDANYVDGEHYRPAVATILAERLAQVARGQDNSNPGIDHVLLDAAGETHAIKSVSSCPVSSF